MCHRKWSVLARYCSRYYYLSPGDCLVVIIVYSCLSEQD